MSENLTTIEFAKFDSIIIHHEEINEVKTLFSKYFKSPKHIIVNLSLHPSPSDDFLELINFFALILKSNSYTLQIFSLSKSLLSKLSNHKFRNIKVIPDLAEYISFLDKIEKEIRVSTLLKSYVDETMKHFFTKTGLIIKRGELEIKKAPSSFLNQINYFQTFELEKGFFSFVIGSSEEFFDSLIKSFQINELAPIFSEITKNINSELVKGVKIYSFLAHPYSEFPTEKLNHNGSEYHYFANSNIMRIPLSCELGEFFLEIWFPVEFAQNVLKFLNP